MDTYLDLLSIEKINPETEFLHLNCSPHPPLRNDLQQACGPILTADFPYTFETQTGISSSTVEFDDLINIDPILPFPNLLPLEQKIFEDGNQVTIHRSTSSRILKDLENLFAKIKLENKRQPPKQTDKSKITEIAHLHFLDLQMPKLGVTKQYKIKSKCNKNYTL